MNSILDRLEHEKAFIYRKNERCFITDTGRKYVEENIPFNIYGSCYGWLVRSMKISGVQCPKCETGTLERWIEGDETTEYATWVAYHCTKCSYTLKVKHVD
jgi:Zn ribbon nucleic-acid-binding protein